MAHKTRPAIQPNGRNHMPGPYKAITEIGSLLTILIGPATVSS